ncbi:acetoacetate--CoA ligase [uncultured Brevundimonas sp.]|uniref:acetoacetate--CoA ligase n=1 Tax=uncultured Brevundimonas sp. TaxID=213418 RepID=UPI0025E653F8|nr:acetoacetate--CoA ligase [uncultured Brevundimonas sp.]
MDETLPLWTPSPDRIAAANVTKFAAWINRRDGLALDDYQALWAWSVGDIDRFWRAVWDYFAIGPTLPAGSALGVVEMPGATWFEGRTLNFARTLLERAPASGPAIIHFDRELHRREITRDDLADQVLRAADAMRRLGVGSGDRVVACLPNTPEAMVAMLATASIGAIWSIVSPETGAEGALARFAQLEPRLLLAVDGYGYRDQWIDRRGELAALVAGLPTLEHSVLVSHDGEAPAFGVPGLTWGDFIASGRGGQNRDTFDFAPVPFGHPLWVLFSSGTTGAPKAMLQSHGGITLEMLKNGALQLDLHAGDRLFFYTITGWMIWNVTLGALLTGATTILYDGQPNDPDIGQLWRIADQAEATLFGASPAYQKLVAQSGYRPGDHSHFPALRSILLSGSPASPECMKWFLEAVKPDLWIQSSCGGTDVCTSFVSGVATQPVYAGEIQARGLGVDAVVLDDDGRVLIGAVGELVIRQPMPSMPIGFWNDVDDRRYRATYFDTYPGQWRQGDFARINGRGGVYVLGRSDATLNRHGVRIGTAEIYRALEMIPDIADSMVLGIDLPDGEQWMPLFVDLKTGDGLSADLDEAVRRHLKTTLSPRHVPDEIIAVSKIPYTRTGKRLEVPLRRILSGVALDQALGRETTEDVAAIERMVELAHASLAARSATAGVPPTGRVLAGRT